MNNNEKVNAMGTAIMKGKVFTYAFLIRRDTDINSDEEH